MHRPPFRRVPLPVNLCAWAPGAAPFRRPSPYRRARLAIARQKQQATHPAAPSGHPPRKTNPHGHPAARSTPTPHPIGGAIAPPCERSGVAAERSDIKNTPPRLTVRVHKYVHNYAMLHILYHGAVGERYTIVAEHEVSLQPLGRVYRKVSLHETTTTNTIYRYGKRYLDMCSRMICQRVL